MGIRVCGPRTFARYGLSAIIAAVLVVVVVAGLGASSVLAGDAANPPADGLSVTSPANGLLAQDQNAENGWLSGYHMSGYASQTFGMWQNPTALKDFTPSRNNLAVSRTLLQVDQNYRLNESNTFFVRSWFVYEPPYSFDSANNTAYSAASNALAGNPFCAANPGCAATAAHGASYGHFLNDWYNTYQVRDAWWENKFGPLTTFIGNQIVVWGQSVAFRVGDVVNPVDTSWAFGFANLEQSRNAQWMIHPILNLPEFGPLSSNFVEGILQPGWAPQWWSSDYADGRYLGQDTKAGRVVTGDPSAMHGPSARFDVHYDNSAVFGLNAPLGNGPYGPGGAGIVAAPAAHEFWSCLQLAPLVRRGFNPVPAGMRHLCHLGLNRGNLDYSGTGNGQLVDIGPWRIPGFQPRNWNEGVRLHTLVGATEITALFYNDATNHGAPGTLKWTPYTNLWTFDYPEIQEAGVTADRPLPIPSKIAEQLPAVFRGEVIYTNHVAMTDMRPTSLTGRRYSDTVTWLAALDIDQAYAPWLTSTGNLTANFEVFDNITMDHAKTETIGTDVSANTEKNTVQTLASIGTSWWWGDFEPNWAMIYAPKGNTVLLFPSFTLNPPWTKKYFLKLQAIEVMGGDRESVEGGLFKGESLLTAQFQYNFNIL